jgi:hypothetical protein
VLDGNSSPFLVRAAALLTVVIVLCRASLSLSQSVPPPPPSEPLLTADFLNPSLNNEESANAGNTGLKASTPQQLASTGG